MLDKIIIDESGANTAAVHSVQADSGADWLASLSFTLLSRQNHVYNLSKRTALYADVGRLQNKGLSLPSDTDGSRAASSGARLGLSEQRHEDQSEADRPDHGRHGAQESGEAPVFGTGRCQVEQGPARPNPPSSPSQPKRPPNA